MMVRSAWVAFFVWSCQSSKAVVPPPVATVKPQPSVALGVDAAVPSGSVAVTESIVSAHWTATGALAFATKTQLYIADEPNWKVREVITGGAKLRLLAAGYLDERTGNLCDYAGKVVSAVELRAFVSPSMRYKALTHCDANAKRCKTSISERNGSDWKPLRTFDASDDLDINSETSPEENFYVRGLGSDTYDVIALSGQAPAVRIVSPHNGQLGTTPPPRYGSGFVLIPSGVGYRKIDASGTVKANRAAALSIPNGIVTTDFDRTTQQLLFQTQAGLALFDVAKDILVGVYPSPACDSPGNMCTAYLFDGAILGDGASLDTKAKAWRKASTPNGTVMARAESGDTLFWSENTCLWQRSNSTLSPSFPCASEETALRPDGTKIWLRDHGTLRIVDRNGKTVFSSGKLFSKEMN
jgi:hypothetical protein